MTLEYCDGLATSWYLLNGTFRSRNGIFVDRRRCVASGSRTKSSYLIVVNRGVAYFPPIRKVGVPKLEPCPIPIRVFPVHARNDISRVPNHADDVEGWLRP